MAKIVMGVRKKDLGAWREKWKRRQSVNAATTL